MLFRLLRQLRLTLGRQSFCSDLLVPLVRSFCDNPRRPLAAEKHCARRSRLGIELTMTTKRLHAPPLEELRVLRERGPSWQEIWGRLFLHLDAHVRAATRSFHWVDPQNDVDDFIADMSLEWSARAADGRLLASWSEDRPVAHALASKRFLRARFSDFYGQRRRHRPVFEGLESSCAPTRKPASRTIASDEFDRQLSDVVVPQTFAARSPFVREQAGLQLHPRLDWPHDDHQDLREHLSGAVAEAEASWGRCDRILGLEHEAARTEHLTRIDGLARDQARKRDGDGEVGVARLEDKIDEAWACLLVRPFSAERVARLLSISRLNTAEQRIKRYRDALPELFPELHSAYEELNSHQGAGGDS